MMQAQKSIFVNVVSWIFIVFSGFGLLISIFQNIMYHSLFPKEVFKNEIPPDSHMPQLFNFMFANFDWLLGAICFGTLMFLISSINLLKRKNWARITITAFLAFGVLYLMASGFIYWDFTNDMVSRTAEFDGGFNSHISYFRIFTTIWIAMLLSIHGFLIFKLNSKKIKQEFISDKKILEVDGF
ncbi:MAG: hypothetical protein ACI85I_002656 [Arenicella sp.]|jgi:hypothetical protein